MLRFIAVFGSAGGLLLWHAIAGGGLWWLLAWPGASCLLVAAAYALRAPRLFGKRPDGSMGGPLYALFIPFQVVSVVTHRLENRLAQHAPWAEVAPGLFIGRRPVSADELPPGVGRIIDLTCEFAEHASIRVLPGYMSVPVLDAGMPAMASLQAVAAAAAEAGPPTLIHCAQGRGRSMAVGCAVLVARGIEPDIGAAAKRIAAVRPIVRLHPFQRRALEAWALARATC